MKLTLCHYDLRLADPWRIARRSRTSTSIKVFVVELSDGSGVVGRGESSPSSRYDESTQSGSKFLQDIDLGRLSFVNSAASLAWIDLLPGGEQSARNALSVALLDGAAKLSGQPLHRFLGLGFAEGRHVTSFSIGLATPEIIRKKVLAAKEFPILKLKVGSPGDRKCLAALREVAPSKPVRVDANEGWKTKEEALRTIEWLAADGNIEFVEQPMPAAQPVADWRWLKARSPLLIFADESFRSPEDVARCAECFHGINIKLAKVGGVHRALQALQVAKAAGLKTMLGCMVETSLLISAGAHLAEACDFLDLDGNLLISNDPFQGVSAKHGVLSFTDAPEPCGLRVCRLEPQ
jgi:L-alanine-DL-glutamate epimerase-like enolase superfamily enzyme